MGDANEAPSLPQPCLTQLKSGLSLLEPLSRKGVGPGLIVLTAELETPADPLAIQNGVPSPLMKWAEEGYAVVEAQAKAFGEGENPLQTALDALAQCDKCQPKDGVGLVCYDPSLWERVASTLSSTPKIVGAVIYGDVSSTPTASPIPSIQHLAGKAKSKLTRSENFTAYDYPNVESFLFATPFQKHFSYSTESVSHTRNLTFLKRRMNGPWFDLEAIWDEHTYFEFEVRDVPKTMATMVAEPYVNHIPVITGGIGRAPLSQFYQHHFVYANPDDTELELISRTVGIDRVIDEFIFKFTHDREIDWLVPGIPPTHRRVEVPFTGVINVRGDRLYHEHIAWDQASVLCQLGLIPEYLPFPYPQKEGPHKGKKLEYRVPVAGIDTAHKMRDKNAVPSNEMFKFGVREVVE